MHIYLHFLLLITYYSYLRRYIRDKFLVCSRYTCGTPRGTLLTLVVLGGDQSDLFVTAGTENLHEHPLLGAGPVHGTVQLLG